MKEVGFLSCPGYDNDVEFLRQGLVALGYHHNACAPREGFLLADVTDPRRPEVISHVETRKNHMFKPLPGSPYIYTAGARLGPGLSHGPAIVDISDPRAPKVVAEPRTVTLDCHDISFSIEEERKLGFCAGAYATGEVKVWDVSNPVDPIVVGEIFNPLIQYSHNAVANHDGTILAVNDEAYSAHECRTGQSPAGRFWFYDITNPALPVLMGSVAPSRGGGDIGISGAGMRGLPTWCTSSGLDWHPRVNKIALTWVTGGMSVVRVSGREIDEIAHYRAHDSASASVRWHRDRLYTNDIMRGLEVFKLR